jgi:hypothetical protein
VCVADTEFVGDGGEYESADREGDDSRVGLRTRAAAAPADRYSVARLTSGFDGIEFNPQKAEGYRAEEGLGGLVDLLRAEFLGVAVEVGERRVASTGEGACKRKLDLAGLVGFAHPC